MRPIDSSVTPMIVKNLSNRTTLLITTEVMALFGASRNTLCKWVRKNGLPAAKMPDNSYRFDPVQLRQWWENRRV
jgi:excisionase family DNA binding protein